MALDKVGSLTQCCDVSATSTGVGNKGRTPDPSQQNPTGRSGERGHPLYLCCGCLCLCLLRWRGSVWLAGADQTTCLAPAIGVVVPLPGKRGQWWTRRRGIVRRLQLHWEWATKAIHQIPCSKTPLEKQAGTSASGARHALFLVVFGVFHDDQHDGVVVIRGRG